MTDERSSQENEDPRDRFRRLLDEAEQAELDATIPMEVDTDGETQVLEDPPGSSPEVAELRDDRSSALQGGEIPFEDRETTVLPVPGEPEDDTPTEPHPLSSTPPPPMLGTTPQTSHPAIDEQGMPLPRRVDEIDINATQVTPAAYEPVPAQTRATPPRPVSSSPP